MNPRRTNTDAEMVARLERLACGDLDETARSQLFAWLEEDSLRWRLCGLAFLEAQSWSKTLADLPAAVEHRKTPRLPAIAPKSRPRRLVPAFVAAASLLVAFAAGLGTRELAEWTGGSPPPRTMVGMTGKEADPLHGRSPSQATTSRGAVLASLPVRPESGLGPVATIQVPVVPGDSTSAPAAVAHPEIPEYVRDQWERRGYRLSKQRRYLFAHLPDGREAVVPVEQVFAHPIPKQVY